MNQLSTKFSTVVPRSGRMQFRPPLLARWKKEICSLVILLRDGTLRKYMPRDPASEASLRAVLRTNKIVLRSCQTSKFIIHGLKPYLISLGCWFCCSWDDQPTSSCSLTCALSAVAKQSCAARRSLSRGQASHYGSFGAQWQVHSLWSQQLLLDRSQAALYGLGSCLFAPRYLQQIANSAAGSFQRPLRQMESHRIPWLWWLRKSMNFSQRFSQNQNKNV